MSLAMTVLSHGNSTTGALTLLSSYKIFHTAINITGLGLHVKCLIFLSDFNQIWIFLTDFNNFAIQNFTQIQAAEPSRYIWTDDKGMFMVKLTSTFHDLFKCT
jgi:hypothetical protein